VVLIAWSLFSRHRWRLIATTICHIPKMMLVAVLHIAALSILCLVCIFPFSSLEALVVLLALAAQFTLKLVHRADNPAVNQRSRHY